MAQLAAHNVPSSSFMAPATSRVSEIRRSRGRLVATMRFTVVAALACALPLTAARAQMRVTEIREGTNMALALSPDGETLVADLLGGLWRLPVSGGGAAPLIPPREGVHHPRFDPAGGTIVFQKLVDGQWDLWTFDVASGVQRQLTNTPHDEREPDFSADGGSIVFAADPDGRFALWSLTLATGQFTRLTDEPGDSSFPAVSDRGEIAYVNRQGAEWTLRLHRRVGDGAEIARSANALSAPSWRPGGSVLIYNERDSRGGIALKLLVIAEESVSRTLARDEDIFATRAAWTSPADYLYTADGRIWRRGIAQLEREPVLMFAAVALDEAPLTPVSNVLDRRGPHPAAGLAGLVAAADGRRWAFTALGDLWLAERRNVRRLTDDPWVDIDPDFTPDGEALVFASDRGGTMALWRLDLSTGTLLPLTGEPGKAYMPAVDPTGRYAAYLETEGFGPWAASALKIVALDAAGTTRTIAEGLHNVAELDWTPSGDGWRIMASLRPESPAEALEVRYFDTGIQGGARAERGERANNDPPRLASRALRWSPSIPDAAYVVRAGRVFDGIRNEYRYSMDVHIEGQRISAMVTQGLQRVPARVIDARDFTIIPGLVDVHVHQSSLAGERLGRIWLAHGVTTVRELTDDVEAALERAESWASGRRPGPRLVVSPELDAERRESAPELPSPLVVRSYGSLAGGIAYGLLRQRQQLGIAAPSARPGIALLETIPHARYARAAHEMTLSPLNRSYQDALATVLESRTFVSTTLAVLSGGRLALGGASGRTLERLYSPAELRRWANSGNGGSGARVRALQNTVARIVRNGGRVPTGSEAPVVPYGQGLHTELQMLADAGIAPAQVLRLATAEGALALGLDLQLGTLEEGKLADFVVIDGNPLVRIADSQSIVAVVRGGVWYTRSELLEPP